MWSRNPTSKSTALQNDNDFLLKLLSLGSIIGMVNIRNREFNIYHKTIVIVLLLLFGCVECFTIYSMWSRARYMTVVENLLNNLWLPLQFIFFVSVAHTYLARKNQWNKFLDSLSLVEKRMSSYHFSVDKRMILFYVEFIIMLFIPTSLIVHQVTKYQSITDVCFGQWIITNAFIVYILSVIVNFARMMKRRYEFVQALITAATTNRKNVTGTVKKLEEIVDLLKIFSSLMSAMNSLFGRHAFFYITLQVIYWLMNMYYAIFFQINTDMRIDVLGNCLTGFVFQTVSILFFIYLVSVIENTPKYA